MLDPIAINRKNIFSIKYLLKKRKKKIKNGIYIIIFPEGIRVPLNLYKVFNKSGTTLAIK